MAVRIIREKENVRTADTVARFLAKIESIKTDNRLYFRGLSNFSYQLTPSLDRKIDDDSYTKWLSLESRLVEFAEQSVPENFMKSLPTLLIANMQHYGIPTRMMDITGNALIALYFACCNNENEDGKVVVFEGLPVSAHNPYANIIADTYRLTKDSEMCLDEYQHLIYRQAYSSSLTTPEFGGQEEFDRLISLVSEPMIIDVGTINIRQRNQDGKFILFPNKFDKNRILNELVTINALSNIVKAVIKIPKESKKKICNQLNYVGVTEGFIYPDDINKVCKDLIKGLKDDIIAK